MKKLIVISPYDPQWPLEFRQLGMPLRAVLGDLALRVDHIGSTSVPGLAAKDVIDVQITVAALDKRALVAPISSLPRDAQRVL
ncbi:MAG TPA: GrpB family protein [Ktedonobacteraceae bacterium]|nr:GrpB family protein [Ktedonobacteraceae bacterium]